MGDGEGKLDQTMPLVRISPGHRAYRLRDRPEVDSIRGTLGSSQKCQRDHPGKKLRVRKHLREGRGRGGGER